MIIQFQDPRIETVQQLQQQLSRYTQHAVDRDEGCMLDESLDQLLPMSGVQEGAMIEWLGDQGAGATTMSLWMAQKLCANRERFTAGSDVSPVLAIVDQRQQLYPPALSAMGIDLQQTVLIHPQSQRETVWSLVQCLRCPSITAVWSHLDQLNAREYRCLQLAAETGATFGVFARPTRVRAQPSWAKVKFLVTPQVSESASSQHRRFVIEVLNCWQGTHSKKIAIERDALTNEIRECHESFPVRLASQLAHSSASRRAARA